ncbi:MAG: porin [Flavobacteriaceae bacterium]|nr:MAG: porin [Flavobacteriaceae bacterium]
MVGLLNAQDSKAVKKKFINAGGWEINVSGNFNASYVLTLPENNGSLIDGGLTYVDSEKAVSSVQNGLLPASLTVTSSYTTEEDVKLSLTVGAYYGLVTAPNGGTYALDNSTLDLRQFFLQISKKELGTFTLGRNFGLFGFDAIINDASLLGVGVVLAPKNPVNTTLGGIGFGYVYADRLTQINYSTPIHKGFTATVGIYQALDYRPLFISNSDAVAHSPSAPGMQGKLNYTSGKVQLSSAFLSQKNDDFSSFGWDVFGKVKLSKVLSLTGYYSIGEGLGSAILFTDAGINGKGRSSYNYYTQATASFSKNTFSLYYGVSGLDKTAFDNDNLLKTNQRVSLFYSRAIAKPLLLTAGVNLASSKNHLGETNKATNVNVGVFVSF